jgi:hypothetical protein
MKEKFCEIESKTVILKAKYEEKTSLLDKIEKEYITEVEKNME